MMHFYQDSPNILPPHHFGCEGETKIFSIMKGFHTQLESIY